MSVIPLLVLCSLALAACAVVLFVWSTRRGDQDFADRLSLLPLEPDQPASKLASDPCHSKN